MNYPKDDIYMNKIPENYTSHDRSSNTSTNTIIINGNSKNEIGEIRSRKGSSSRLNDHNLKDNIQKYNIKLRNKNDKSQQNGRFRHIFSRIKIWCSGICVNRVSLYDDTSSADSDYKDRIQAAPLLLHDHGTNNYKQTNQSFMTAEENPTKHDDIWTMESKYIREKKPRNSQNKRVVTRQYRQRVPQFPPMIDSSFSIMSNDTYGFYSDKYTEI